MGGHGEEVLTATPGQMTGDGGGRQDDHAGHEVRVAGPGAVSRARALVIIVTLIMIFADRCHIDHQSQCHGSPKLAAD